MAIERKCRGKDREPFLFLSFFWRIDLAAWGPQKMTGNAGYRNGLSSSLQQARIGWDGTRRGIFSGVYYWLSEDYNFRQVVIPSGQE